ncbi:MAG: hypothetical protein B6D62_02225 [Candidatus Cloacimonas sp. 4484_275]|nr:MAG: hypothetical protein B6D62_02225 [Candidatus Cloacimonas sp. 4484_275]RLC49234.1 MAG: hypothetical protein DRZ79_06290 [Candidatus Cloacimonadota bacterium]
MGFGSFIFLEILISFKKKFNLNLPFRANLENAKKTFRFLILCGVCIRNIRKERRLLCKL